MGAEHLHVISERIRAQAARLDDLAKGTSDSNSLPNDRPLLEAVMQIDEFLDNARRGSACQPAESVARCLAAVNTEVGKQWLAEYLQSEPFPHYEQDGADINTFVRVLADGTRTRGRFVGREFRAID